MARKYDLPVYANENAMEHLIGNIPTDQKFIFSVGDVKRGDIEVESFGVSHDAAEPMFYAFITIIS